MKKLNYKILVTFVLSLFMLFACEDRTELTAPAKVNTGNVDFSRFVSIGNSLTHGVQSDAVFETAQKYSFGKQIANQVGTEYEQSIISDPGSGGRLEIKSISPFSISANPNRGVPTNLSYQAPYNNLGVSWAFLYDALNAKDSLSCFTAQFGSPNPLFNVVLRGLGTQFQQAKMQKPTMLTFWLGNNDILLYATRGGTLPFTPVQTFAFLYKQVMDSLETLKNQFGTKVIVANIPSVTSIPFFTTVGPAVGAALKNIQSQNSAVKGLVYQTTNEPYIGIATPEQLLTGKVLLTLDASAAAKLIGDKTGAFYSLFGIPVPPNVNTAFPFGLTPENPWPNKFILDVGEISNITNTTAAYNATISSLVSAKGFVLVDVNAFLNNIASNGFHSNGMTFTSKYVEGGLFSLDGIHPTSQGYAIIANLFIETINKTYNAEIPKINVSTVPGSLSLAKKVIFDKYGIPNLQPGALTNLFY